MTYPSTPNETDSVLKIIDKKNGIEKLELLDHYARHYGYDTTLVRKLEQEAEIQGNRLYKAISYRGRFFNFTKERKRDSIRHYLDLLNDELTLLEKEERRMSKEEKRQFIALKKMQIGLRGSLDIEENRYNLVMTDIKRLLEGSLNKEVGLSEQEVYHFVGMAYLYSKNREEAISSFRKSYSFDDFEIGSYGYYDSLEGMAIAYGGLNQFDNAIRVTDTLIKRIEEEYRKHQKTSKVTRGDEFKYQFLKNRAKAYLALWYIKLQDAPTSRRLLDEVVQFIAEAPFIDETHPDLEIYYFIEAEYHLLTKQLPVARDFAKRVLEGRPMESQPVKSLLASLLLARIMNAEGCSEEAFELMNRLYRINDSIHSINFSREVAELRTIHEVETAEILIEQQEVKLKSTRAILFLALLALLFFATLAYLVWKNRKTLVVKNRKLNEQYKEILKHNQKIAELQSKREGMASGQDDLPEQDAFDEIMSSLDKYLNESKAFKDPDVKREDLAKIIGTNRQYLIEAIKEKTGKTFNEYIYTYRLQMAYDLIVEGRKRTVAEISNEVGFSSRATFYKAFKETYGMTPNELRGIIDKQKDSVRLR